MDLEDDKLYCKFLNKIDSFVNEKLDQYTPNTVGDKTIHDPIWGSVTYYSWEIHIIDSPLFQRLRNISQVGLAVLTYPAARHSRFEHSLGTTAIASRMIENIVKKHSNDNDESSPLNKDIIYKVRLAALLHDIGHCFYSHLSECVYGQMEEMKDLKSLFYRFKNKKNIKAHEIFSYMIINTDSFKKFFNKYSGCPIVNDDFDCDKFMLEIGNMIIGVNNINKENKIEYSFQTAIINGVFDADKLDYIKRDSYSAGLTLIYDIERLLYKIDVKKVDVKDKNTDWRLTIDISGITALEEIIFCKIMLHSYIYHHQKVLASEEIVKDLIYSLITSNKIKHPCDFLKYTDNDLDYLSKLDPNNKTISEKIKTRDLPIRCFEFSRMNVSPKNDHANVTDTKKAVKIELNSLYDSLKDTENSTRRKNKLIDNSYSNIKTILLEKDIKSTNFIVEKIAYKYSTMTYNDILSVRKEFINLLTAEYLKKKKKTNFDIYDVYIVIPTVLSYNLSDEQCIATRNPKKLMSANDFIKLSPWADAFNANKWRGYVFVSRDIDKKIAFKVAKDLLLGKDCIIDASSYIKDL